MLDIHHINIVGTIHTKMGLIAARQHRSRIDIAEFRADILPSSLESLRKLKTPLIWTVRSAEEGGAGKRSLKERAHLYEEGLEVAALVDIELASAKKLQKVIAVAKSRKRRLVLSFHDFSATPSSAQLKRIVQRSRDAGADIVKIAATVDSAQALSRLLGVFEFSQKTPLAVMGMGKFGKVSRLVCAQAGSVLNYGWLDRPQVPGQWAAAEMAERFRELGIRR